MRRLLALSLLISSLACGGAAGLAAPAALAAGSGATSTGPNFSLTNGGVSSTPQTTTINPVTTTASSGGGLSSLDAAIIAVVGVLTLGGVAFWIWYDARGHAARVGHEESLFSQRAHAGSKTPRKPRKLTPAERKRRKRGRAR